MATQRLLKHDILGTIIFDESGREPRIVRHFAAARPGCRWLARRLAKREAAALARLSDVPGIPRLISIDKGRLVRSYLTGCPMHTGRPRTRHYFQDAFRLLRCMHRAGIAHNDLAKEANWVCLATSGCGIVDFQLAIHSRRRGRIFRLLAREDLRHLLKHKRHYLAHALTARERSILDQSSWAARLWRILFKPIYHFATRKLLGWPERADARERQHSTKNLRS